ncbi:AAA family ATPase [Haloferula sp. A504]|uniref:AAA family ATPase n=1 Tax=Haloferula sp. A504 TaxID=3373601 RepID=UPI0031C423B9|nr:AAA family ATPase [Verrucomicrobiaceae bacterium E54]
MNPLDQLTIRGFKSIRELEDFKLRSLNLFIGANGAGKSNLIGFFRLLNAFMDGRLNDFVIDSGGVSDLLFNGRKVTGEMYFETRFGDRGHRFTLKPGPDEEPAIVDEARYYRHSQSGWWEMGDNLQGRSKVAAEAQGDSEDSAYSRPVVNAIRSWQIYHFHDTSRSARMRLYEIVEDDDELRTDGANLAPFLKRLRDREKPCYTAILDAVRLVSPFFDDFVLEPRAMGAAKKINLSWRQKGSDYPMQPYHLSDGTIRFIALATALLQPEPPSSIIIDEPELGLHPHALSILAELIQDAAKRTQLIIATQSATLLDQFGVEDIVVVKREDGASTFSRLEEKDYKAWLESYTVGELWTKNVIAGGPSHE